MEQVGERPQHVGEIRLERGVVERLDERGVDAGQHRVELGGFGERARVGLALLGLIAVEAASRRPPGRWRMRPARARTLSAETGVVWFMGLSFGCSGCRDQLAAFPAILLRRRRDGQHPRTLVRGPQR